MTKINEALNKETLEDVQAVFANAIEDIKATFEGAVVEAYQKGVTHGMTLGMSVEHTNPKYKTEKRKAKVGERVVVVNPIDAYGAYRKGDIFTTINFIGDEIEVNGHFDDGSRIILWSEEYEVLVEDTLEDGLIRLRDSLKKVAETVKKIHPLTKSANQQRAALIEKAREFVAFWTNKNMDRTKFCNKKFPSGLWFADSVAVEKTIYAEFVVNEEKRTVVALIRNINGGLVRSKGIAKCHPNEVFNADIGKAIALARALEIDVPSEFLDAVQPDEVVVGMEVFYEGERVEIVTDDEFANWFSDGTAHAQSAVGRNSKIINDTNPIYEVEK